MVAWTSTCLVGLTVLVTTAHASNICAEGYWTYEPTGTPVSSGSLVIKLFKNMVLRINGAFSGLSSPTTGAKLSGISDAAVQAVFPLGVKAGYFNMRFDLNDPSTLDPAFLSSYGTNITYAMLMLADNIYTSMFSFVVTTSKYPNGELSGSTQPCSSSLCFTSTLSGSAVVPPNKSPGKGKAQLTLNAYGGMQIHGDFSKLTGTTTAASIGILSEYGSISQLTTVTSAHGMHSFPSGKVSDSFNFALHLNDLASFQKGYLIAYNSSVVDAANAFVDAVDSKNAYFTIMTTTYPNGEITGYFNPCS